MAPKTTKARPAAKATPPSTPAAASTSSSKVPSTPAKAPRSLIPLQHYGARVPLQLAALFFALSTSSSRHVPRTTPQARILHSLIEDPVAFLGSACAMVAVVQVWFGVWCKGILDQAQQQPSENDKPPPRKEVGEKKSFGKMFGEALGGVRPTARPRTLPESGGGRGGGLEALRVEVRAVVRLCASPSFQTLTHEHVKQTLMPAVTTTIILAFVIHVVAFTLGAPLIRSIPETFLLSLLVSILAFLPLAITFGQPHPKKPERFVWLRLFSSLSPQTDLEIALLLPALGALAGAWLGAVPMPLDWDRAWQKWPTTCVVGTLLGYGVGSIVALVAIAMEFPRGANLGSTKPKSK
ncbi:BZ3500_MvSof-1268-A1-R1_Chr3-1g05643 [Microbotryum saponariae]|uniref:BZ3500_MvSof-1268-A1-R1_Chr3-1g05643 protein n=1 Tax=Microbotryum saponariae TaxID=289078 RepID=A0A2X0LZB6_9BASI|nr:BZ3500_MvSof-1268-A1-R1_Chr3-1g05643 [Microbotryum saponariae]SDA04833.1 BZ3501_MvSof-1269-A2-R1_Chr3-1g05313 [Microbotryum saponariae]